MSKSATFCRSGPARDLRTSALPRRAAFALALAVLAAVLLAGAPARAGTIVWGLPTTISGDADVSTLGTTLSAHNLAGPTISINGVTFVATAFGNIDPHFTLTGGGSLTGSDGGFGSAQPPFASLSANYKDLLDSGGFTQDFVAQPPPPITLLARNLTVGTVYEFQWWANEANSLDFTRTTTATSGGLGVTLDHNVQNVDGGLGQFAVGTFLADATTQEITFQGAGAGNNPITLLNGWQLRVVPEPATTSAAIALGAGAIVLRRRR